MPCVLVGEGHRKLRDRHDVEYVDFIRRVFIQRVWCELGFLATEKSKNTSARSVDKLSGNLYIKISCLEAYSDEMYT